MSVEKARTTSELTRRQKKKWIAILFIIWVLSTTTIYYYVTAMGGQTTSGRNTYKGWYVSIGDTATYEVFVNSNTTAVTIADKIAAEYHFTEVLKNKNIFGVSETTIKVTRLPDTKNITRIAEVILSFKGPAVISQEINGVWENKSNIILPFFIPVGYWNELNGSFKKVLPANAVVLCSHSWTGEYDYNFRYTINNAQIDLFLSWDDKDGVLQAMELNVTKGSDKDSISLILSGLSVARENSTENLLKNIAGTLESFLVFLFIFGPPVGIWVIIGSITKYETPEEKETLKRKYANLSYTFDEIKRSVKIVLSSTSVFSIFLGFVSFSYIISISSSLESDLQLFFSIIFLITLGIIVALLTEVYVTLKFQDIDKKPNLLTGIDFMAFFIGMGDYFLLLLLQSVTDFLSSILLVGIVVMIEIFLLIKLVRKTDKIFDEIEQNIRASLTIF